MTDHGNMFGAITLYKAAKEAGVQAILGCELEVVGRGGHARAPAGCSRRRDEGYKNLVWLVLARRTSTRRARRRRASRSTTSPAHAKGLVGMTGCMGGVVAQAILEEGEDARARRRSARCATRFEPGSLYVELQDHGLPEQPVAQRHPRRRSRASFELPLVATNDVHYAERDDAEAHLYLSCIKTGRTYDEAQGARTTARSEMYLKSPDEMAQLFSRPPRGGHEHARDRRALRRLKLKLGEPMLPSFQVPEGYDTEGYFRHVAREGLERALRRARRARARRSTRTRTASASRSSSTSSRR